MNDKPLNRVAPSFWVIMGYMLWVGFYLGALMLHAINK
jgi:hypothetical protein